MTTNKVSNKELATKIVKVLFQKTPLGELDLIEIIEDILNDHV
jgi:hypothetical protein